MTTNLTIQRHLLDLAGYRQNPNRNLLSRSVNTNVEYSTPSLKKMVLIGSCKVGESMSNVVLIFASSHHL